MEKHALHPSSAFPHKSRGIADTTSTPSRSQVPANKPRAGTLPGGLNLSPEKQRWRPTLSPSRNTCRRLVGPRKIESLFERKYLVNKQALLWSDLSPPTLRRLPSEDTTPVDKANADSLQESSAFDPRFKSTGSRSRSDKQKARTVAYASSSSSPSEDSSPSSSMTNSLSPQNMRCNSKTDPAAKETNRPNKNVSDASPSKPENEHLFANKSGHQPLYACMERAVDLFLDHNKLLEDIQRVQRFGTHGAVTRVDGNAPQDDQTAHEAEAATTYKEVSRKGYAASSFESGKGVAGPFSPADWEAATAPRSHGFVMPAEVDASAVGALNSVSMTRVSGTQAGSHVVLSALEWERFKRTVTNLISANLELQSRLRLTQRHFRSLGYSGNLEQTLAKLKSEELRVRRELAVRESQFADSFTLSAKLQHHKIALETAEQGIHRLKDQALKIGKVKEMLKQVKGKMQPLGLHGATSHADAPDAGDIASLLATSTESSPGADEPSQGVSNDPPYIEVEVPYVEIHKCVRLAANKCFIVSFFAPANALNQRSAGEQDDGKATDERSKIGHSTNRMEPVSEDQEGKSVVPTTDSTMSRREASAIDDNPDPKSQPLTLKRVGQLFLRRQMEETISRNSEDLLLVVYNGETSDANIQPLRIEYARSSTGTSRPAVLHRVVELICRNLRLSTLPFDPDAGQTNYGESFWSESKRYTLKYTRPTATDHVLREMKEKTRIVLGDEVDETSIHDADEELLYVGCHAMSGCSWGAPRHYLIRLYRCPPRYLVARVFSPRSAVLHSCWIDAHWAMQIYNKRRNITSTSPAATSQTETAVVKDGPTPSRDGVMVPHYKATTPLNEAATPPCQGSAATDVERVANKRKLVAALETGHKDAGGAPSSATAFTRNFIRFVASSLAFKQEKLCFAATEACGTEDGKQQPSIKRGEEHQDSTSSGEKEQASPSSGNEKYSKNRRPDVTDLCIASDASTGQDINASFQQRLSDIRKRQRILQYLSDQSISTSSCNDVINIIHAQIVQRSPISQPESYVSCFMLIRSCVTVTLNSVTFVVYEPASSWFAGGSFSLIDALTLLRTRKRNFLQRLAVDKDLLKELVSAARSSSTATHKPVPGHENQKVRKEKEVTAARKGRISPQNTPYLEKENLNLYRFGCSRSPREAGFCGAVKLVHAAETSLGDVRQRPSVQEVSECAKSGSTDAGSDPTEKRSEGHWVFRQAASHSNSEINQPDEEKSGTGTDNATARQVPESAAEGTQLEKGSSVAAAKDLTKSFALERQKGENGGQKSASAIGPDTTNRELRSITSLPSRTGVVKYEVVDAQEKGSAEKILANVKVVKPEELQKGEPDTVVERCTPALTHARVEEQSCQRSGATKISDAELAEVFEASVSLPDPEQQVQRQSLDSGVSRQCLSEAQWRSLLQEMFAGLKVSGDNIIIPGLPTVSEPELWKIITE